MSAAEKLKALDGRGFVVSTKRLNELRPQIVAVVEAAEKYPFDPFSLDKLWLALAALDEALSPPTGGSP